MAFEIGDDGVRTREGVHFARLADCDEPIAADGEGLGGRRSRITGPDLRVDVDPIGRLGRLREGREREQQYVG